MYVDNKERKDSQKTLAEPYFNAINQRSSRQQTEGDARLRSRLNFRRTSYIISPDK